MNAPCDWDQEAYCCTDDCHEPATHRLLTGMLDELPMYELVCCTHANVVTPTSTITTQGIHQMLDRIRYDGLQG